MKKIIAVIICGVVLNLILCACSSNNGKNSSANNDNSNAMADSEINSESNSTVSSVISTSAQSGSNISIQPTNRINIGDYILLGKYNDEPILWRCVDVDEEGPLMLSDRILCIKPFDAAGKHIYSDKSPQSDTNNSRRLYGSNLWETSTIHSWLNSMETKGKVLWPDGCPPVEASVFLGHNGYAAEEGFLAIGNFSEIERNAIKTVKQKSLLNQLDLEKLSMGGNKSHIYDYYISRIVRDYDVSYYHYVSSMMFLLDIKQVSAALKNGNILGEKYYLGLPTQKAVDESGFKHTLLNAGKEWHYWLRTPNANKGRPNSVFCISSDGSVINNDAYYSGMGVRPAFYTNLSPSDFRWGNGSVEAPYKLG